MAPASAGHAAAKEFDTLLKRAGDLPPEERRMAVEQLRQMVAVAGTPVFEGERSVLFLYFADGAVPSVGVLGDMTGWDVPLPMECVPGTGLWYRRDRFEPDARLEYCLSIQGDDRRLVDPLNPHVIRDGWGPHSEFAMPEYRQRPLFGGCEEGRIGVYDRVTAYEMPAGVLGYPHEIFVYLPPGYTSGDSLYPAVLLNDGRDYVEFACIPSVLDRLIEMREIEPLLCVFVSPPHRHQEGTPNRMTEYGLSDAYVSFLADELVPWVHAQFRADSSPGRRLVAGASFGGLCSFFTAFRRPDVFGLACCQSSYFSFRDDAVRRMAESSPRADLRVFADVGIYERVVGPAFIPPGEWDFLEGNRRMRDALQGRGYDLVYREYPEGHTWGNWRAHLVDSLKHFFGAGGS